MKIKNRLKLKSMKIKVKSFFLTVLTFCLLALSGNKVIAQDYSVKPLSDYLQTYKNKQNIISKEIESDTESSFGKKLAMYDSKIIKLKEEFKYGRKLEYHNKVIKRAKKKSCTGTRIRSTTNCESIMIKAPNPNMYTKEEWVTLETESESKYVKVFIDSSFVTLKVSSPGMRVNKAGVYVTFKYIPELIDEIVEKESVELFNQIAHQ